MRIITTTVICDWCAAVEWEFNGVVSDATLKLNKGVYFYKKNHFCTERCRRQFKDCYKPTPPTEEQK